MNETGDAMRPVIERTEIEQSKFDALTWLESNPVVVVSDHPVSTSFTPRRRRIGRDPS